MKGRALRIKNSDRRREEWRRCGCVFDLFETYGCLVLRSVRSGGMVALSMR